MSKSTATKSTKKTATVAEVSAFAKKLDPDRLRLVIMFADVIVSVKRDHTPSVAGAISDQWASAWLSDVAMNAPWLLEMAEDHCAKHTEAA